MHGFLFSRLRDIVTPAGGPDKFLETKYKTKDEGFVCTKPCQLIIVMMPGS